MPKINLRLTDSEHEELRRWASESHRSIQREAIFRLFSERSLSERYGSRQDNSTTPDVKKTVQVEKQSLPARSESDHFKPDFK